MTPRFRYAVVGRGLTGAAAARHLAEQVPDVVLIGPDEPADRQTHGGVFASHYDEGRITRTIDPDENWARLANRSIARYRDIEARSRSGIDGEPGRWVDIGSASTVPYDGALFNNTTLGPSRNAWSGAQTTWRNATVPLGSFNGQQIQFRFRFVSDQSASAVGFWLDDINATGVSLRGLGTCDNACN